jgi:beta-1,4-mannosyl-glycoprotein beta-1,4-N-acetylglucosaminyltransferase
LRIIDTFLFDDEADLLEHRLREGFDLVDTFVLVEAAQTFRGQPKEPRFAQLRDRLAWASAKLLPITLHSLGPATGSAWDREAFQRNAIMMGLRHCAPEDIVLLLDADEIPSRSLLERLRQNPIDRPHRLAMTRHYEAVDRLGPSSACCPEPTACFAFAGDRVQPETWGALAPTWFGRSGVVARYRDLVGDEQGCLPPRSPYLLRRQLSEAPVLPDAGRHLHAVDEGARLETKLDRVSHAELADDRAKYPAFLRRARRMAIHHHGWWYAEAPSGPLPEDLQRLIAQAPALGSAGRKPGQLRRQIFRTWAWLRFWPALPQVFVQFVDRHYASLELPLFVPLSIAAGLRHLGARLRWRWLRRLSMTTSNHGHL